MNSSEIGLLNRVADLARRYGLRPSEAEAAFGFVKDGPDDQWGHYVLSFDNTPVDPEKAEKFNRMMSALGCEGSHIVADDMDKLEDVVERAISLAPRVRSI